MGITGMLLAGMGCLLGCVTIALFLSGQGKLALKLGALAFVSGFGGLLLVGFDMERVQRQRASESATPARSEDGRPSSPTGSSVGQDRVSGLSTADANAIKVVDVAIQEKGANKLGLTGANLRAMANPRGEGILVFSPRTEFFGVKRLIVWLVLDGKAYPLNGATKNLTPQLPWPREVEKGLWKRTNLDPYYSEAIALVFKE